MNYLNSYNRVNKRGFKLNPRRLSIQGLRARFLCFFRLLRSSYGRALRLVINRSRPSMQRSSSTSSRKSLVPAAGSSGEARLRSYARSNSFYTEAIAECLEFIKRTSVSADEDEAVAAVRYPGGAVGLESSN